MKAYVYTVEYTEGMGSKVVGLFSTKEKAEAWMARVKAKFPEYASCYVVFPNELDKEELPIEEDGDGED